MNTLIRIITNRLLLAFLGVVSLALCIWYIGPLISINGIAPLESVNSRAIAIAVISFIWLISAVWRFYKARRDNRQMLDSLADQTPRSANEEATAEELAALDQKMAEAIATLKQRNFKGSGGKRFLYQLPWYTIIGPPGAGKTTLLSNSGLDFPLEETHGKFSVKGVGGTRNCDWWFTDQAVLLDTAGRYTTQDSEAEVDRSAWVSFLKMLKEKRSQRPLNGVLVAISLQDLLENDADALAQTAKIIRTRIEELYKLLGIAPPIYLMITKCDLMAGFSQFFASLDQQERQQVWGFTLPLNGTDTRDSLISDELTALGKTINTQTIARMHRELSEKDRESIYTFPMQFAAAQQRVQIFTQQLTINSALLQNILFRGIYFTSATQTGSAIDRVIANVSASFGVNALTHTENTNSGKSFFINTLLKEVIFRESGLAGTNLATERKLRYAQLGAGTLVASALIGLLVFWTSSFFENKAALQRVENTGNSLQQQLQNLPSDSLDIVQTSEMLSDARRLAYGEDGRKPDETSFVVKHAGLFQGDVVNDAAEKKYRELLIDALLPRLMVRLEHQMHGESTNNEFVFEALKTYQMIGNRTYFDSDAVTGWFNFDINANLPSDTSPAQQTALKNHIAALFKEPPYRLPRSIDQSLVRQYQQIAAGVSLEQRAYSRLKTAHAESLNTFYKITDIGGADISRVFNRADNVPIDQSIPQFFTRAGYNDTFLSASKNVSQRLVDDSWVLGEFASETATQQSTDALQQSVTQQYFDEYIEIWESLISSVQIKPVSDLNDAAQLIALLTETRSPLKNLLVVTGEQTLLAEPPTEAETDTTVAPPTDRETELQQRLGGGPPADRVTDTPLDPVTQHFGELHSVINNWQDNASQLDEVLLQLSELNLQLLPMAQNRSGSMDPQLGSDLSISLQKINTRADRLPEPLASLLAGVSNDVGDVAGGGFCQQLNAAWQAEVYGYYERAIRNRYPVNRRGTADIALSDFGNFFGRNGIIDQFVTDYLDAHVSRTPGQWTWVGNESAPCLSDDSLKQLAFAEDIKNTFFTAGGQAPAFQFDIIAEQIDVSPTVEQLVLTVGSRAMEFSHGPIEGSTLFRWPDTNNNMQVSLRALPPVPGTSSSINMSGPWAVLRLLDQGVRRSAGGRLTVDFSFGGRAVSLTMATSSFNPLNSVALRNFRLTGNL